MKITKLSVEQTEAGRLVTVTGLLPNNAELEQSDFVRISDLLIEGAGETKAKATEAEAPKRGRGRPPKDEKVEEKAEEPAPRQRREVASDKGGISDADLQKAASAAAEVLGPDHVKELIEYDLGVASVGEIPQDKRQKFLDWLKDDVAKKKAEAPARSRRG